MEDNFRYDISFIIPVYNTEKFLVECLESIIKQEGFSKEIITIDDGSSDGTLEILENYQNNFKYIRIFQQEHQGASVARNKGIDSAQGNWICFVDSDDYLENGNIKTILEEASQDTDIIFADYAKVYGSEKIELICSDSDTTMTKDDFKLFQRAVLNKNYNKNNLQIVTPWAKLYRTDFLKKNKIRFTPGVRKSQDLLFNFEAYQVAEKGKYFNLLMYYYRYNCESLCNKYMSGVIVDYLKQSRKIKELLLEYDKFVELKQDYYFRCAVNYMFSLRLDYAHCDNPKKFGVKKREFEKSWEIEDVQEALKNVNEKEFSFTEKVLLRNVKRKKFLNIYFLNFCYGMLEKWKQGNI